MTPLISIIVPVYNVESYLQECLNSLIIQTLNKLEIILIDDGSPDNCPVICDEYAKIDKRIKVIHQENAGLSAARNAGLEIATGEYICFVDSDDLIHPQYCEILLKGIREANSCICCCNVLRFYDENPRKSFNYIGDILIAKIPFHSFFLKQMTQKIEMGVVNRIFKTSLFKQLRFKNGKLHEDIFFAGDLFNVVNTEIAIVDCELYFYRQRNNSIVNHQIKTGVCHPDRVLAGDFLYEKVQLHNSEILEYCLNYALDHPWSFVDSIYVKRNFKKNKHFLKELQNFIKKYSSDIKTNTKIDKIKKHRMLLFGKSRILYGINAYARLLRVYLYHIIKKDAYADGHGI